MQEPQGTKAPWTALHSLYLSRFLLFFLAHTLCFFNAATLCPYVFLPSLPHSLSPMFVSSSIPACSPSFLSLPSLFLFPSLFNSWHAPRFLSFFLSHSYPHHCLSPNKRMHSARGKVPQECVVKNSSSGVRLDVSSPCVACVWERQCAGLWAEVCRPLSSLSP